MDVNREHDLVFAVIGGSGMYQMSAAECIKEHDLLTPYGQASDLIFETRIHDRTVFFLPRHGKKHHLNPSEVPYRANIAALKHLGVTHLLSVSAVGIMKSEIAPGDLLIPEQMIDWTHGKRAASFFEDGAVGHLMFADPFSSAMREYCLRAAQAKTERVHSGGTYLCVEGPRFSTRAESQFFRRSMDPSCIGMTGHPEAPLAKEAGLEHCLLSLATDYDCWKEDAEDVSIGAMLDVIRKNSALAESIVAELASTLPRTFKAQNGCLSQTLITPRNSIPPAVRTGLDYVFGTHD